MCRLLFCLLALNVLVGSLNLGWLSPFVIGGECFLSTWKFTDLFPSLIIINLVRIFIEVEHYESYFPETLCYFLYTDWGLSSFWKFFANKLQ